MAIDDAAGRKAVRERLIPVVRSESVFVAVPRHSLRIPQVQLGLREDVHLRALDAARKALRAHNAAKSTKS